MTQPTPEPRPRSDEQRHLGTIEALQRDYDEAEQQYECAKAEATSLKKVAEKKARALFRFIRHLNAPAPLFEMWRQTPVNELQLSDGIIMLLEEAGLDTIGKLADWTAKDKRLTDIPHIGEAKAEAIEKALDIFWSSRKAEGEA